MKSIVALACALSLSIFAAAANPKDSEFEKIAKDYIENYLSSHPEFATELGDHRFDGILSDYSPETRARMLAKAKQVHGELKKFDDYKQLTGANQIDVRILRENVDYEIFKLEELREAEWNPLVYNQSLANSLYLLVARDFDSAQKRIPNLRQRMDGIPNVIKQAEANLQDPPRVHTETAIEQIQGAINLVRNGLDPLLNQAPQLKKDLAPIQEKTAKALEDYKKWLQGDLLKRADGDFRLGAEKFRKKLHFALASDLSMPEIKRGQSIAYCDSSGPLEKNGKTFFAVAPTPNDWQKLRKDSFFREYNNFMVRDLTVHEAMPGHYLQLSHSNEFHAPTLVRAIFQSGPFIEGWAVYTEQVMAEQGYGGPEVKMQQLKMRLRATANSLLDQGIHAGTMTEQQAMDLMTKATFQEQGEATLKWKRARLTSAQLSTYFVGVSEHLDLRAAAQKKFGKDFDLKKYNDQVISYGSPPVKYVRELMGL